MPGNHDELLESAANLEREQASVEGRDVDSDRLLAGEDPASPYPEDAAHWAGVYSELIKFKHDLLRRVSEDRKSLSAAAMAELERDERLLSLELERLKVRLTYWQRRHAELARE